LTLSTAGIITGEQIRLRTAARPPAAQAQSGAPAAAGARTAAVDGNAALGSQLESIERDAIMKALEKTRYNKTAAAKLLGMSFRALRYRIKKLGIE
jgi:two-component system response regulator PilR (NtrC family)